LEKLNIFNYPGNILTIEDKDLIRKIIYQHDHGELIQKYSRRLKYKSHNNNKTNHITPYVIDDPIHQQIGEYNILTTCLNGKIIVGLIFEQNDNPYDYRDYFTEQLHDYLNSESNLTIKKELEIENLMISLFIAIRRYSDEVLEEEAPEGYNFQEELYIKVFIMGLDNVGKSCFVRRIKTGEYEDGYFMPSREFNIEYIKRDKGLLALWDMPGQANFRKRWLLDKQDSNIYVFMIDAANEQRFKEAKVELWRFIRNINNDKVPLLILGNKIDKIMKLEDLERSKVISEVLEKEIIDFFDLNTIENRRWKVFLTSVKKDYNLDKVIEQIFDLVTI
jgi:small GTP-binding protein